MIEKRSVSVGRRLQPVDGPLVRAVAREAEENDYRISSFILAVVKSDAFHTRDASVADADGNRN